MATIKSAVGNPQPSFAPGPMNNSNTTKSSITSDQSSPRSESRHNHSPGEGSITPAASGDVCDEGKDLPHGPPTIPGLNPASIPPHLASAFLAATSSMQGLPFPFGMFPQPPAPHPPLQEERSRLPFGNSHQLANPMHLFAPPTSGPEKPL